MHTIINSPDAFLSGQTILINKPLGWTSFSVVKKIKYLLKKKYGFKKIKVGHAGTLDPLATGLLIICTGKFTKRISIIQNLSKTYTGVITLGATTPSYDLETDINNKFEIKHITKKMIYNTTNLFIGNIKQTPPIFSALKKNGERLYLKARRGEKIDIKNRTVNVDCFQVSNIEMPNVTFKIKCSKGTYIRSIADDFGKKLNSGAHLSKLCRTTIGEYKITKHRLIPKISKYLIYLTSEVEYSIFAFLNFI